MRTTLASGLAWIALMAAVAAAERPAPRPPAPEYEPSTGYTQRDVAGWTVHVSARLVEQDELCRRTMVLLETKLHEIAHVLPVEALGKLREIPIWMELDDPPFPCACYHPSKAWLKEHGLNPDKARAVEIANAATFLQWTRQQPSMVLHELAHGYHDRFLEGGYGNGRVAAVYEKAKESGGYESVLHWNGKHQRAYAMNNPQEYFAELTEAWFGTNDFYPFVRAEVVEHDAPGAELLKTLWGE